MYITKKVLLGQHGLRDSMLFEQVLVKISLDGEG